MEWDHQQIGIFSSSVMMESTIPCLDSIFFLLACVLAYEQLCVHALVGAHP
jgi:hypothetical protein